MSLADLWDRTFWSIMVVVGVGLLWIRFVEPYGLSCVGPGLIVALAAGAYFFVSGVRGLRRAARAAAEAAAAASAQPGDNGHA